MTVNVWPWSAGLNPAAMLAVGDNAVLAALMIVGGGFGLRHAAKLNAAAGKLGDSPITRTSDSPAGATVRLRGRVGSDPLLKSPLRQTLCCCYRVEVDQSADDGTSMGSGWRPIHEEVSSAAFFIEDESGRLPVQPQGLQFDMPPSFTEEVIGGPRDPRQQLLVDYVARHIPNRANTLIFDMAQKALLSPEQRANPEVQERLEKLRERKSEKLHKETRSQSFRFREICILPGQECELAGTIADLGSQRALARGPSGTPFLISTKIGETLDQSQRRQARTFAAWSGGVFVLGLLILIFGR